MKDVYLCQACDHLFRLNRGETIRCRECGSRVVVMLVPRFETDRLLAEQAERLDRIERVLGEIAKRDRPSIVISRPAYTLEAALPVAVPEYVA